MWGGLTSATIVALVTLGGTAGARSHAKPPPIKVCATTTSLASLATAVGGEHVDVTALVAATEDPRGVVVSSRLLACVRGARLLIVNGFGLEGQWLQSLLDRVGQSLRPGGRGYLDASGAIRRPLDGPYYLLDPVWGLAVAGSIRGALEALEPASRQAFTEQYQALRARLGAAMVGERLASKYPVEKLADLYAARTLGAFLAGQHETGLLGGWFAARPEAVTTKVLAESDLWAYFGARFHVEVEPRGKPGTSAPLVLTAPFSEPPTAEGDRRVVPMALQVGSRPGTDDYVALIDYDLRSLAP
jgi:hypothetical protein